MIDLLDTHQHLIYPDKLGYAWVDDLAELTGQGFTLDEYGVQTSGQGVGGSVFMETGVDDVDYKKEARFMADLMARPDNRMLGMIASCRPETEEGFDAWLDECTDMPVMGFRRILHVMGDEISQSETFVANVKKIGRRNLTFDMCFKLQQLPLALKLARACQNTVMILDHCGSPDIAGADMDPWQQYISDLAVLPNVNCKISGLLTFCRAENANLATIRPYIEHVIEAFGADRVVWGSDWPVVNMANGVGDWIKVTRAFLGELSSVDAEKLASRNAMEIYKCNF